jgi:hypothetical protein
MSTNTPTRAARPRICPTCKATVEVERFGLREWRVSCLCAWGSQCASPRAALLSWERAERNKRDPIGERRERKKETR